MSLLGQFADRLRQRFFLRPIGYGHPVPKEALDAEYRSGHWDHFGSSDEFPRYERLAGLIGGMFPQAPAVLDLGCGSGRLAILLQKRPLAGYLGVDLSSEGVGRARGLQLPGMEFVEGDFETWRPTATFDVIVFNESAGYARDPAALLVAFSRHLRPGGFIIVSQFRFGNHRALWRRILRTSEVVRTEIVTAGKNGRLTWDLRALRFPVPKLPGA
jgi:trans-aconitate methyltransferase